jgi:beta-galactosidase
MKKSIMKVLVIFIWMMSLNSDVSAQYKEINMNFNWRFAKGNHPGAYAEKFADSDWRVVDIPHDWSIEDLNTASGPFDKNSEGQFDVGYTVGGKAWYRKTFRLDSLDQGKIVHLQFDGIYMNADIWINNYHVGSRAYGYSTFWLDITPYIIFGQENVIAVEVKNIGTNSRWYSGSGIYRPVSLKLMSKVHISHWGSAVRIPSISTLSAELNVISNIVNHTDSSAMVSIVSTIKNKTGKPVVSSQSDFTINPDESFTDTESLVVQNPDLWDLDSPSLYTLFQDVFVNGEPTDQRQTPFGIRSITYNAKDGFMLNGKPVLLQGSCMHHDNYMLGSAAYARAEERRVELTKAAGYNAIRCAHNPPSQAFLEACDRMGILVIDEAFDQWTLHKWDHDQDYGRHFQEWWQKDLESMVMRDRNHPSIIMWSIGNEIPEQGSDYGITLARELKTYVNGMDPTRPVTMGVNREGPAMDGFFKELDIVGYNYRLRTYESDQARVPDRVSYGSESFSRDAFAYWQKVEALPYIIGDFVWTGWDYMGEASIGWNGYAPDWTRLGYYPWHAAFCGEIDLTGYKRPASYYRDVLWKTGKNKVSAFVRSPDPSLDPPPDSTWNLHWTYPDIHPSWTWPEHEGQMLDLFVYSACEEVELFLNRKSLGRKKTSVETEYMEIWKVMYEPGELKAIGYKKGKKEAEWILRTAGKPAKIRLTADRSVIDANGQDLSYVTVELLDKKGNRVYDWREDLPIHFDIQGEGILAGVGNADPISTESFQKPQRSTFRGRCVAVLKSSRESGEICLKAEAEGIKGDSIIIQSLSEK